MKPGCTPFNIPHLRAILANYPATLVERRAFPGHATAAVAMMLRETPQGTEVLFILRAIHAGDPWSGNIAFPGGHIEPDDVTERAAAERETLEELGIDLSNAEFLGRLDDVAGAHLPVIVACFAYLVPAATPIIPSAEIMRTFWIPLVDLADPARQRRHRVEFRGELLERPAIDLLGPGQALLWGITYRMVGRFMELAGVPLPPTPIP